MRADLPAQLPLICPACRRLSERGRELFTLSLETAEGAAEPDAEPDSEIEQGVLRCDNPACRRRYPIVDGVPLILPNLGGYLHSEIARVVEAPLSPAVAALLAAGQPEGDSYPQMLEHLSIYLEAHYGDRIEPRSPPLPGAEGRFGLSALAERIGDRRGEKVARAVELGCGVGRGLWALSPGAGQCVGVDLNFAVLRRARRLLLGQALPFGRRVAGRHYVSAQVMAHAPPAGRVDLICGDALDPPLCPAAFDRVVALNVLDSVPRPAGLLAVADGLCRAGGEVILSSPYAWQGGITPDDERLGAEDPAAALRQRLTSGQDLSANYAIEDEAELSWWLRRDARSMVVYRTHYLRARSR